MGRNKWKLVLLFHGFFLSACQQAAQSPSPQARVSGAPQGGANDDQNPPAHQKSSRSTLETRAGGSGNSMNTASGAQSPSANGTAPGTGPTNRAADDQSMRAAIETALSSPEASKLTPDQRRKLTETLSGVCDDAAQGKSVDQKSTQNSIKTTLNLGQALGNVGQNIPFDLGSIGNLGNIDQQNNQENQQGNGLEKAIRDLVNAAQNANVDGILKAVRDIVGAS